MTRREALSVKLKNSRCNGFSSCFSVCFLTGSKQQKPFTRLTCHCVHNCTALQKGMLPQASSISQLSSQSSVRAKGTGESWWWRKCRKKKIPTKLCLTEGLPPSIVSAAKLLENASPWLAWWVPVTAASALCGKNRSLLCKMKESLEEPIECSCQRSWQHLSCRSTIQQLVC